MEGPKQPLCVEVCGTMNRHEDYVGAQGMNAFHKEELRAILDSKFNLILCTSTYNLKRIKL